MKRKAKAYMLTSLLSFSMVMGSLGNVYAYKVETEINAGEDGTAEIEHKDNNTYSNSSKHETTSNTNKNNETSTSETKGSTNDSYTANQNEKDASQYQNEMRDVFRNALASIQKNNTNGNAGYPGVSSWGEGKISPDELQKFMSAYKSFNNLLDKKTAGGQYIEDSDFNTDHQSGSITTAKNFSTLTQKQKTDIIKKIAQKEGLTKGKELSNLGYPLELGGVNVGGFHFTLPTKANIIIREDLIKGGLREGESYVDRYDFLSNAMDDYLTVISLSDYHVTKVDTDYVEYEDYTPDKKGEATYKRQLIDKKTGQVLKTITGNSNHIKFTGVPVGEYTLKSLQHKTVTKAIRAYYQETQYLFDKNTKTVLFVRNVDTESGDYVDLGQEKTDEWVTLSNRNIKINALGKIEGSNGVERVE